MCKNLQLVNATLITFIGFFREWWKKWVSNCWIKRAIIPPSGFMLLLHTLPYYLFFFIYNLKIVELNSITSFPIWNFISYLTNRQVESRRWSIELRKSWFANFAMCVNLWIYPRVDIWKMKCLQEGANNAGCHSKIQYQ